METTTVKYTDDCLDPGFGYENGDGYVRIWDKPKSDTSRLVFRHRWFWELQKGPIPEGYEINHLCKNRRCCNVNHLECIDGKHHATISNEKRYSELFEQFKLSYVKGELAGYSQADIGVMFGRSQSCINAWLKRLKI